MFMKNNKLPFELKCAIRYDMIKNKRKKYNCDFS